MNKIIRYLLIIPCLVVPLNAFAGGSSGTSSMSYMIRNDHVINIYKGFEFYIGAQATTQGALTDPGNYGDDNRIGSTVSADFVISKTFAEHHNLLLHLESAWSPGLDAVAPFSSALFGQVNYDSFASFDFRPGIPEAYYEGRFFDERLDIMLGRMDPTILFDDNVVANDETTQFLNEGFRNNRTIDFPAYTFGGKIAFQPVDILQLSAGAYDSTQDSHDVVKGIFWIGELGLTPEIAGLQGNYRFYGWGDGGDTGAVKSPGWGVGTSIDQKVTGDFSLFARGGYARKDAFANYLSFSGGVGLWGGFYGRKRDMLGLAYGVAFGNKDFGANRNAQVMELFYRAVLVEGHVQISPDLQYLIDPTAVAGARNILLLGLRLVMDL